jgi:thiol-disulfide isomerase/thioredoxin
MPLPARLHGALRRLIAWLLAWLLDWRSHALTLLMAVLAYTAIHLWQTRHLPSGPAPAFQAAAVGPQAGGTIDFDSWRQAHPGRAVALHFWADWCPICRLEEDSISALQADWPLLSVAMQSGDAARVQGVLNQRRLDWATAVDADGQIARRYGLASVPAFIVVDAQGRIRFAELGYTTGIGMRLRLWWAQNT